MHHFSLVTFCWFASDTILRINSLVRLKYSRFKSLLIWLRGFVLFSCMVLFASRMNSVTCNSVKILSIISFNCRIVAMYCELYDASFSIGFLDCRITASVNLSIADIMDGLLTSTFICQWVLLSIFECVGMKNIIDKKINRGE